MERAGVPIDTGTSTHVELSVQVGRKVRGHPPMVQAEAQALSQHAHQQSDPATTRSDSQNAEV
jgi:hypothetical protein